MQRHMFAVERRASQAFRKGQILGCKDLATHSVRQSAPVIYVGNLVDLVSFDSLDQINVLLAIEEKHGYKIPDKDVKLCESIRSTLDYLATQK